MTTISWEQAIEVADVHAAVRALGEHLGQEHVALKTQEGGLFTLGSRYWLAVGTKLMRKYPKQRFTIIVDAGEDAGIAMGAIADGHRAVRYTGDKETFEKLRQSCGADQSLIR